MKEAIQSIVNFQGKLSYINATFFLNTCTFSRYINREPNLYYMKKMKEFKGKLYAYKIEDYKMMKLAKQKPLLFESILMLHCSNHDRNASFYHVTLSKGKAIVDAVRFGRNTFLSASKHKGKINHKLYSSLNKVAR